jgi:hypothetical protein
MSGVGDGIAVSTGVTPATCREGLGEGVIVSEGVIKIVGLGGAVGGTDSTTFVGVEVVVQPASVRHIKITIRE